jgi:hypothetical protein
MASLELGTVRPSGMVQLVLAQVEEVVSILPLKIRPQYFPPPRDDGDEWPMILTVTIGELVTLRLVE